MAELLERLFSHIRRPRAHRVMRYEPYQGTGGSSPGMRGAINPIDSMSMTDRAQGVDISSVAPPTRLTSARAGEAYSQPQEQPEEQPAANPFMFASQKGGGTPAQPVSQGAVQYQKRCDGQGNCWMEPVFDGGYQMTQQAPSREVFPDGFVPEPGYVPGSLREVTKPQATASSPIASAAPAAASPQGMQPTASAPQEQPAPASNERRRGPIDVDAAYAPVFETLRRAEAAPSARQARILSLQAEAMERAAVMGIQLSQLLSLNEEADQLRQQIASRGKAVAESKTPASVEAQYQEAFAKVLSRDDLSIDDAANAAVDFQVRNRTNVKFTGAELASEVERMKTTIASGRVARTWGKIMSLTDQHSREQDPGRAKWLDAQRVHLDGVMTQDASDALGGIKDEEVPDAVRLRFGPAIAKAAFDSYRKIKPGSTEEEAQVFAQTKADTGTAELARRVVAVRNGASPFRPAAPARQPAAQDQRPATKGASFSSPQQPAPQSSDPMSLEGFEQWKSSMGIR